MPIELIAVLITSVFGSGAIGASFSFANARAKIDAENQVLLAEARKINVETDISLIDQLTELNVIFFDRVTTLEEKLYKLEVVASNSRTQAVDMQIRVKRLEAELEQTLDMVESRDKLIIDLQTALDECRAKLKAQTKALEDCLGAD